MQTLSPVHLSSDDSLATVLEKIDNWNFGATDCALPMLDALEKKLNVDVFIVLTDNETWFGDVHPSKALKAYQEKMNPNARLVVVGMTATEFSIAEQDNPNMLDVVGFDASTPEVIADFCRE